MSDFKLKDSGERREFASGAVRDRGELKPRPDLISPHAEDREGWVLARGAEKYAARNWEKGIPISECIASISRHLMAYKLGLCDEDHMAQLRTNAGFILHYEEEIKAGRMDLEIDDMPKYAQQPDWETDDGRKAEPVPYPEGDVKLQHDGEGPFACPVCSTICPQTEQWVMYRCPNCDWTPFDDIDMPENYDPKEVGGVSSVAASALSFIAELDKGIAFPSPTRRPILYSSTTPAEPPTFYIAGPMRGYKDLNFKAFDEAAERGRQFGYNIISPADLDRENGIDPQKDPTVVEHEEALPTKELNEIVHRDVEAILALDPDRGDGIAVLPGWEDSTGATAEVALAQWLGLRVILAEDFHTEVE